MIRHHCRPLVRRSPSMIEPLEGRELMSASALGAGATPLPTSTGPALDADKAPPAPTTTSGRVTVGDMHITKYLDSASAK